MHSSLFILARVFGLGVFAAYVALVAPSVAAEPKVVATVAPVHSLVWAVTEGITEPALLLPSSASPHNFQLRPSQVQILNGADIIFWIGPTFETSLVKNLQQSKTLQKQVELSSLTTLHQLRNRENAAWHHQHDDKSGTEVGTDYADHNDVHIWLDPVNASHMVDEIAQQMGDLDTQNAQRYRFNAANYKRRLERLHLYLDSLIEPVRNEPFLVFHDAFHHLEYRYGLQAVGAVTVVPERQPGAKHLTELRTLLLDKRARCVFHEPQFVPRLVDSIATDTGVRVGVLDALGIDITPGPSAYLELMKRNVRSLVECLQR
jgi:zinc transport system substrate-binding protein